MKTFVATIALASTLALPATAQTYDQGPRQPQRLLQQRVIGPAPDQAYARAIQVYPLYPRLRSPNPAFDVYSVDGRYVGSDPDPRVRSVLQNDDAMLGND